MPSTEKPGKRVRLVQAALSLVYKNGFAETRLADIAEEAEVPPGNVYYYFKTKEEIGEAILEERLAQIQAFQQKLAAMDSAQERLSAFIQMTCNSRQMLAVGGCPIGSLCTELHKEKGALAEQSTVLFAQMLGWLKTQFEQLGRSADSQGLAVHLLSALEGIAVLAHSLGDPEIVVMETERLQQWIRTLQSQTS